MTRFLRGSFAAHGGMLVAAVGCALLLAACGSGNDSNGDGGGAGGDDAVLVRQGTNPDFPDLGVRIGLKSVIDGRASLSVSSGDGSASETVQGEQGDTVTAGEQEITFVEVGEDDTGQFVRLEVDDSEGG
jgi:hypothetical protein